MAEDDHGDQFLFKAAMDESDFSGVLTFVEDGEELMDYLRRCGRELSTLPSCLVLDLKMPLMDGREALWEIRQEPAFRNLPIVVLTTSDLPQDKEYCMELGASDFMTKPASFDELISVMRRIQEIASSGLDAGK